jgi:hypothetical protein
VSDGTSVRSVALADFADGVWIEVPLEVPAGATVTIRASRTAGANAVLSGIFLGGAPTPLVTSQVPQGSWVGEFGAGGFAVGAWGGNSASDDLVSMPSGVSVSLESGARWRWSAATSDVRALQSPDAATRRASTWYSSSQVRARLDFADGYSGMVRLYAVDWDGGGRAQTIEVSDGTSVRSVALADFADGVWIEVPLEVPAGATVTIRASRTAGANAVVSGMFLDDLS